MLIPLDSIRLAHSSRVVQSHWMREISAVPMASSYAFGPAGPTGNGE